MSNYKMQVELDATTPEVAKTKMEQINDVLTVQNVWEFGYATGQILYEILKCCLPKKELDELLLEIQRKFENPVN